MKEKLLGKNPEELKAVAQDCGLPSFVGRQLADWIYVHRVRSFSDMTNISRIGRETLAQRYDLGVADPLSVMTSSDGTRKYLFAAPGEGAAVEAVIIPDDERRTLCVSSHNGPGRKYQGYQA